MSEISPPQKVRIQTPKRHIIDGKLGNGMRFGLLESSEGIVYCNVDASRDPSSHRQLVRILMHQLFKVDPDPTTEEIPTDAKHLYEQYYRGAGFLLFSRLKRCANIAYGQLTLSFESSTCLKSFGFVEPKNPLVKSAVIKTLIEWGREHLVPFLDQEEEYMTQHADNRLRFENASMVLPPS